MGWGETALAEVNALKPKVSTLESKVSTLENRPTAPSPSAYVVQSGKSDTFWWKIWSDGLIEQYVVATANYATDYFTITFPKAFSNKNYFACAASTKDVRYSNGDRASDFYYVNQKGNATAAFSINTTTSQGKIESFCIFACGY